MGIKFSGIASGMDTQSIINDLMKVEKMRVDDVQKDKTMAEWKKDAWAEMNTKLYTFYKESVFDLKSVSTYMQKQVTSSDDTVVSVNNSPNSVIGTHTIEVTQMAKGSFLAGTELTTDIHGADVTAATVAEDLFAFAGAETLSIQLGTGTVHDITINPTDTIDTIIQNINDTVDDISANFDSDNGRIFLMSKDTGAGTDIHLTTTNSTLLENMGFAVGNRDGSVGQDALLKYNGVDITSASNDVSVNGLELTINADSGTASINATQDTDAIYDTIKNFVEKYNELILDISEKVYAESARGYEPLTSEEKESMTDEEVKLWEEKIKKSLLRRDDTLSSISSNMRSVITTSSGVDTTGFDYKYLSDLGIVTGAYTEKGILHIEGDEDDVLYGAKENKLRAAIEDDPDKVMELLSAIGQELYDDMSDRMKSTSLSSALTFYNDKYMDDQVEEYEDKIYDLEQKLAAVEERYYKQFTAMEQAIQKANSTSEWFAQQLGGM